MIKVKLVELMRFVWLCYMLIVLKVFTKYFLRLTFIFAKDIYARIDN